MTPDVPSHPDISLAALFGAVGEPATALAAADLPELIKKKLAGIWASLPQDTREKAIRDITASAAELLRNVRLIDVLIAGWREYNAVTSVARHTLATGSTEEWPLVTHEITETSNPYVSILVDEHAVATIQLSLSIVCDIQGLLARISAGRLVAIESGRCRVTGTIAIEGAQVTSTPARFELPGVLPLGQGLPLLPAREYLAAG
jgi:hypothetical protein